MPAKGSLCSTAEVQRMTSRFDQIDVTAEQIGHALKDKKLWVPANQRDYSWKDKHVEDLYSDSKIFGAGPI